MGKSKQDSVNRRDFIKGSAAGMAVLATSAASAAAQASKPQAPPAKGVPPMSKDAETGNPATAEVLTTERPGADFMVDVIKSLDIDYVPCNPAQSFRGLHESLIDYGGNTKPEFLTCTHEELSLIHI